MPEKVIVLGSGPAAWTAAIYAARAALEPLVFEGAISEENRLASTLPLGQLNLTTEVENFPGFPAGDVGCYLDSSIAQDRRIVMAEHLKHGVSGPELMELMRQQAANFGTRIITEDIQGVDFKSRPFKLFASDDKAYEAQSVIVATGARANYLGLPSEDKFKNRGVSACAICDGALPRFRNKPLVVIGGGDSAVEEASYLSKFGSVVHMVHRRDQLRASKIMARRALDNSKIKILWNRAVQEVLGNEKQGVTGVCLTSTLGEPPLEVDATGVFMAIGHTPNSSFLQGALELTEKKYIKLVHPQRMLTSVEGIFAAGDVADDYYRQAITAAGMGCKAAIDVERWLAGQE